MASSARIDEIKKKFDENPRRYFAPLANEFRKAGDLEQAILICEEFLPQQAGHMSGHIVYGQALFEAGRLPESRTVFETALGLDPENLIALRHLGDIAKGQGEPGEARRWYERVLEADPRNEEIQGLLAALDAAGAPAPAAPVHTEASQAPTVVLEAIQREEPPANPLADLATVDLDMDDAIFATPAPAPAAAQPPAIAPTMASPQTAFDSISLAGLEPTNAEAATSAAMPEPQHARAEGLEPSEFEVPAERHARAEGLEPAEFEAPTALPPRAEGLETSEFEAPARASDSSLLDLESSFAAEVGGATTSGAPSAAPLAGLEPTAGSALPAADEPRLPSLDLDQGLAVPSHAAPPPMPDVPLGLAAGPGAANPRLEPPAAMEAMPALASEEAAPSMMELPPEVIAAESTLMDLDEPFGMPSSPPPAPAAVSPTATPGGGTPFVTETMAELYLKQGFHDQALTVYRQLSSASPGDARLRARVAELEQGGAPVAVAGGPTVREFFYRLANRRPGDRAAEVAPPSPSDFGSFDAIPEPAAAPMTPASTATQADEEMFLPPRPTPAPSYDTTPEPEHASASALDIDAELEPEPVAPPAPARFPAPEPVSEAEARAEAAVELPFIANTPAASAPAVPMPSASERAQTANGTAPAPGSIDALFGNRVSSSSEDSAASALAQAFGNSPDAPVITGRPARAASGELSLDSVFRDGPPRPPRVSQSFSFDQFFSESASTESGAPSAPGDTAASSEPAERSADDVKQFNSWLQGLKPR